MKRDEITEKVHAILREHGAGWRYADDIEFTPTMPLFEHLVGDHLGIDVEAARLEMTMAAEEVFDIDIPDGETDAIRTVDDLVDYIARRLDVVEVAPAEERRVLGAVLVPDHVSASDLPYSAAEVRALALAVPPTEQR